MDNIPKGYKKTEIGVIPEDWRVINLGELGDSIIGLTYNPKEVVEHGLLVHRSSNIKNNSLVYDDNVYVSKKVSDKLYLNDGDILVCVRNGSRELIGKSALISGRSVGETFGAFMSVFRTYNTNPTYLFYQIISSVVQGQIRKALGATINQITNKSLNGFLVPIPEDSTESDSIAITLSDIDSFITSLEKLIEKKKMIRHGVMQELLTGKRRLPGFSGEWGKDILGNVVVIKKGSLITSGTLVKGNIPVIAGGKQPAYYHSRANRDSNTITISASGANAGYVSFHEYPIFASDCSTISESNTFDVRFIYHWLRLKQNEIYKRQSGGAQPHIHPSDLNPMEILFPETAEQERIAEVISDMNSEEKLLELRLSKLKQIKQGAMQQLLTGKIRLINK